MNWAPYLYSGTLIVIFICLILMSLNVSLMWCILTLPWRSISAVHLVPPLTGNLGLGMRFVDCYFFATAVFLAQRKKKPGGTLIFHAFIECFHSRGQHLCKLIGTKESVCIRKEFNSQGTGLGHQHGRRFIVLGHQYGCRDVMWKHYMLQAKIKIRLNFLT